MVKQRDGAAQPILKRQALGLASPRSYLCGTGILTGFPFSVYPVKVDLRTGLPPADDALPGNPCPFGGEDSHLSLLLLPPGYSILTGPLDFTAQLPPSQDALLPDHSVKLYPEVSAAGLAPSIFRAISLGG